MCRQVHTRMDNHFAARQCKDLHEGRCEHHKLPIPFLQVIAIAWPCGSSLEGGLDDGASHSVHQPQCLLVCVKLLQTGFLQQGAD